MEAIIDILGASYACRHHEALHCYQEALLLDTCWVSTYLEAADALHRRAIEVSK